MAGRIQGKVAIITGGASGIGEGMVRRFCNEGGTVLLADIDAEAGLRIADDCNARFVQLDVARESDWIDLEQTIRTDYGRLDILVNNAGIVTQKSILEIDLDTWNQLLSINLTGVMLGCRSAVRMMRDNPDISGGSIINTASTTSYLAIPDVAYTTSKAGIVGLTKSVAVQCAAEGLNIRVNSIHPGATHTNILKTAIDAKPELEQRFNRMSPLGRMGTVEEVAAMALFLASDESSFCTGGQFPVEGGTVSKHP